MSAAARVRAARNVIVAAWECGRGPVADPATEAAQALESSGQLLDQDTATELDALRRDRDAFRVQRNAVFKTNERLIGSLQEEQDARLRAENDVRKLTRERDGLRARVAELEAEQGNNDGAKAPWGRAEDGRPYLPEGGHWTDVPELVDRTVAGIQARVDQAQPGHWYTAPATETGLAPGTVRTRVDGYLRTVGQFTNVLPADLELILHAHGDLSWCLEMLAKFRARVAELEAERQSTNALVLDLTVALRAAEAGQVPDVYPPAMPWAKWLDDEDRADFLDELAAAAIAHVGSAEALAEVESTCSRWRVIADATRAHLTAPGPDCTCSEPVLECTGESCGCPVCHRAVVPAADVPVPYSLTEPPAVVTSYAEQSAAAMLRNGGERS